MRHLAPVAIAIALSTPALAAPPEADALKSLGLTLVQPMSTEQLARTRQAVAAEIARAGASAVFADASDANSGKARHLPSGLVCPLGKQGQRILVATADSASCETRGEGTVYRTTVQRAPAGATLDWAAQYAQTSARSEPGYKPLSGLVVTGRPRPGSDGVEHRTLVFSSKASGRERNVRLQTGLVRGWLMTERQDRPRDAQPNMMADLLGEAMFGSAMKQR